MSTGDAERQPVEGVETLDDLAGAMDASDEVEQDAPEVEDEDSEAEVPDSEDAPEEQDEDEEQQDEPVFTIKVDGKEIEVPQSKLIELGQQGLDYTKKTMAVAEERKAAEAERSRWAEVRQQNEQALDETIQRLEAYSAFMEREVGQPPSMALLEQDSRAYILAKEQYEARKGQLQQASAEIRNLREQQQRSRQAALLKEAEATEKALKDTLPGWDDATLIEVSGYLEAHGLPPALNEVFAGKGIWEIAHKAKAYDALQAQRATLKPVAKLSKVQKPSATNQPVKRSESKRREAEARYSSNPSLDTLAGLVE